jgi:small-conductance mechanosensitive channel
MLGTVKIGEDNSKRVRWFSYYLLIAVGVMAIGLALKMVGPVDILSVLAISGAVLLLITLFLQNN